MCTKKKGQFFTFLILRGRNERYTINWGFWKQENRIQKNQFTTLTTFIIDFSHAIDFCNCWMHRATCAALRASDNALLHTLSPGAISSSILHWNIEKLSRSHPFFISFWTWNNHCHIESQAMTKTKTKKTKKTYTAKKGNKGWSNWIWCSAQTVATCLKSLSHNQLNVR